jgi:hypothetical protein
MSLHHLFLPSVLSIVAIGCSGADGGSTTSDGGTAAGDNVAPLIVDDGPTGGGGSVNVPFVTVTLCVPGTTQCQTIDHVTVDSGSSGMRVVASVLTLALPQVDATTGDSLVECLQFDDGYTWGSVRTADVKISGETAAHIPIQLIGDPAFTSVPSDCSSSGPSENTVMTFGSNGLIGINQIVPDCGEPCTTSPALTGQYYSCAGTACSAVPVAAPDQISNPIAFFAGQDTNGAVMQFPGVPASGAATLAGSLIFGIGTRSNNGLGTAKVQTLDDDGNFSTSFDGATFATSYVDSGTNTFSFNDGSIPPCTDASAMGFDCPTSTVSLMATNSGSNSVMATVSFSVANADTLFATNNTAFDNLATPGVDNNTFAWGFPFFIGRSVYIALDGAMTPGGAGPYVGY